MDSRDREEENIAVIGSLGFVLFCIAILFFLSEWLFGGRALALLISAIGMSAQFAVEFYLTVAAYRRRIDREVRAVPDRGQR